MSFNWIGKSADGKTVTLKRLNLSDFRFPEYFNSEWEKQNADLIRIGCVLDVETSGLDQQKDEVIEIGIRQFKFNRENGDVLVVGVEYSSFQDPGFALSEEVKSITGITDEMLKDQKIDWSLVDQFLQASSIIIAHNASFDRPFIDSKSSVSSKKIWGCSLKQIDWQRCGYPSQKLEVLSIYHGFFNDSHRALSDVDSLLYLLSLKNDSNEKSYLDELLNEARKTKVHVIASFASFDSKEALKSRNYRWDPQGKFWSILVNQTQMSEELSWLEEKVYFGSFKGKCIEIPPIDQFKAK